MNPSNNEEKNTQEVEIRALLDAAQKSKLEHLLSERDAQIGEKMHIIDKYLCQNSVDSFEKIEMNQVGSFSLRIRKQTIGSQTSMEVNTKTITSEDDHNAWEEHEVSVSSFEETVAIFQTIGFKPFFTLEKERATYHLADMTVCLEDIVDFGPVIEVEIMAQKSQSDQTKQQIKNFLAGIGVSEEKIVAKSVTNMLMRERVKS